MQQVHHISIRYRQICHYNFLFFEKKIQTKIFSKYKPSQKSLLKKKNIVPALQVIVLLIHKTLKIADYPSQWSDQGLPLPLPLPP